MAAAERRHEPGGVRLSPQRQGGQLQARGPPLGAGRQCRHRRAGQVSADGLAQQRRRLLRGEAQLSSTQLSELPAGPQPRQRQRRVRPARQHQPQPRRQMLGQEQQRPVDRLRVDQVVVIEDQHHLILSGLRGGQFVDQRRHQTIGGGRHERAQQRTGQLANPGACLAHRRYRVAPEPRRIVVRGVQRQPGHRPPATPGPVGQQDSLAGPSRGADQDQPSRQPLLQPAGQPRAGHKARLRAGHMQLGSQQDILPGRGGTGRRRRRRLSHPRPTPQRSSDGQLRRWVLISVTLGDSCPRLRGGRLSAFPSPARPACGPPACIDQAANGRPEFPMPRHSETGRPVPARLPPLPGPAAGRPDGTFVPAGQRRRFHLECVPSGDA